MADNTILNPGVDGDVIATDEIGGVKHQRVKLQFGSDGTATDVSEATPLPSFGKEIAFGSDTIFGRYLTQDNDGVTFNGDGDYSSTPGSFRLVPNNNQHMLVNNISVTLKGSGTWNLMDAYGGGARLTNGINLSLKSIFDDSLVKALLPLDNIKDTIDWTLLTEDPGLGQQGNGSSTETAIILRGRLFPAFHIVADATGANGTYIEVLLQDDFTSRISGTNSEHSFLAGGIELDQDVFSQYYNLLINA